MPVTPPAPPAPPQFRLATRYPTTINFPEVLQRAGVDGEQQQRVRKAQELLRSLPEDSPAAVKRQIVEAAFTAFDVPTQKIIAAATAEVEALEAFIEEGGARAQQVLDDGAARIAELEAEIAEIRESMAAAVSDQGVRDAATVQQINGVKPILSFFAQTDAPLQAPSHAHAVSAPAPAPSLPSFAQPPRTSEQRPIHQAFQQQPAQPQQAESADPVPSFMQNRGGASLPDFMTDIDVD